MCRCKKQENNMMIICEKKNEENTKNIYHTHNRCGQELNGFLLMYLYRLTSDFFLCFYRIEYMIPQFREKHMFYDKNKLLAIFLLQKSLDERIESSEFERDCTVVWWQRVNLNTGSLRVECLYFSHRSQETGI